MACGIDAFFQAEIDRAIRAGIQHVVTFVLGIVHAELVLNVFGQGMHLK